MIKILEQLRQYLFNMRCDGFISAFDKLMFDYDLSIAENKKLNAKIRILRSGNENRKLLIKENKKVIIRMDTEINNAHKDLVEIGCLIADLTPHTITLSLEIIEDLVAKYKDANVRSDDEN